MKFTVGVLLVGAAVGAGTTLAWPVMSQPDAGRQEPVVVTMTGCLRAGSDATVLILRGATPAPPTQEPPRDHLLVQIADGVDTKTNLNKRVEITGRTWRAADGPSPPAAANTVERALRRLEVRQLKLVAESCSEGLGR